LEGGFNPVFFYFDGDDGHQVGSLSLQKVFEFVALYLFVGIVVDSIADQGGE